jgi:hypothetical protein
LMTGIHISYMRVDNMKAGGNARLINKR